MNEETKQGEDTSTPVASQEEKNSDSSKLDETSQKTTEELANELAKAQETLKKAEHTIVQLKKNVSIDVDAIKTDILGEIKKELSPSLSELSELKKLKKDYNELKASIDSQSSQVNLGEGYSEKTETTTPTPSQQDIKIANKYFNGDVQRYLKYRVNN
jgi:molecular chaperone GrpE (heat shock protein)